MKSKKVCLVLGAGAGIGATVAKKFSSSGYHSVLCRRTDKVGLDKAVKSIKDEGGIASGYIINAIEPETIEKLIKEIEANVGPINVAVYNLGSQIGNKNLYDIDDKVFERGWKMATQGLFRTAKALFPHMEKRGKGTLLVTSSTSAVRGNKGQHSHAASMGGRRMLCQTLNAEFSCKGIHTSHIIIDGAVDAPDTLGKMLGQKAYEKLRKEKGFENDGLLLPERIAETYFHLAHQHRSAWTHELDLRAYNDEAWWNTNHTGKQSF
jgi:NAD(P)-dependent dehydrogenase (short-subunit alcohol dehydrogenase family)